MQQIRQRLSIIEMELRSELAALAPEWQALLLSDVIEQMASHDMCHHALYSKLVRLDAALCQLDIGLYGLCSDCEADIEAERLSADPTEQRCHHCDDQYNLQHRQELRLSH
ncbi:TraR/DksA family transcriptional regulator [Shewanella avicenniae]|uniref:TraR/DksA family transcriptional regulator n=2 Tax=Shewanella avicenniae TaxID=2814294 RepID=A0ABX7QLV6_9GAMM|nr:TraR/DksA family transcriptional regulator [Shewanella avicenniae]QSX32429.1 TraR/DksA family transcriptional regulator [Shewanella avicenniae]